MWAPDTFYPIVPDSAWVARLARLGVRTIQLRLKDTTSRCIVAEIEAALEFARRYGCDLIVNDHWQQAISLGAKFVHLGQEDLATADREAIARAGLKLGISTHSDEELAIALAATPDYIALGPIFETKLKAMRWAPQGLERIGAWKRRIGSLPLVAIGGITLERAPLVSAAGAQSIAVVTDFLAHPDPEARVRQWLDWQAPRVTL